MIVFELVGREDHPVYEALTISNGNRQYNFLKSITEASLEMGKPFLSQHVIKALNFQAITCLHTGPGEYRPCEVEVGQHRPPAHYRVAALMDDFINVVNRSWDQNDAVVLATYVLWRLNYIHPFINGNGRSARAACYFVLCLKNGAWVGGETILPELLRRERAAYCDALQVAHDAFNGSGEPDLGPLHSLVSKLLDEQTAEAVAAASLEEAVPTDGNQEAGQSDVTAPEEAS